VLITQTYHFAVREVVAGVWLDDGIAPELAPRPRAVRVTRR
jgi:hypothetical protein